MYQLKTFLPQFFATQSEPIFPSFFFLCFIFLKLYDIYKRHNLKVNIQICCKYDPATVRNGSWYILKQMIIKKDDWKQ